jgi:hypothetical protein
MTSKRHSYLLSLLLSLIAVSAMGQGQVFIMGQVATSVSSAKLPEIVQVRTHEPLVSFDLSVPYAAFTKTTLFNREARMSLSSITTRENPRTMSASITSGTMPMGTVLKLNVEPPAQNFKGDPGNTATQVALSPIGKTILSDIGTCFSGKKPSEGYVLEYLCEIPAKETAYQSLKGREVTVTITVSTNL